MLKYIMVPIIGAIIGYATNWIAVKMLFRPHHEKRLFGMKVPFTPGVIPKGQGRLARAVGRAVEEQLLNDTVIKKVLLSDEMKEKVTVSLSMWVKEQQASDRTFRQTASRLVEEERLTQISSALQNHLTETVYQKLLSANVGHLVAQKVLEVAREKLAESMFGMMLGGSMLDPIAEMAEERINEYVAEHSREYISEMVATEEEKLENKTVGEGMALLDQNGLDIPAMGLKIYEELVQNKLSAALSALKLSAIVEDRINAMEVAEVEDLLMSIMKKELGAIVNLGALIGFVLGLVNVAILLL